MAALSPAGKDQSGKNLLDKVSAEVAPEVSPLLNLLLKYSRLLVFLLVAVVAIGIGWGGYAWYSGRQLAAATLELGELQALPAAEGLEKLKTFAAGAPSGLKSAANLALAQAALYASDYATAASAWEAVAARETGPMAQVARIGKAQALVMAGKDAEALAVLQAVAPETDAMRAFVDELLVDLAEKTGNIELAVKASRSLAENPALAENSAYWMQKAASLQTR